MKILKLILITLCVFVFSSCNSNDESPIESKATPDNVPVALIQADSINSGINSFDGERFSRGGRLWRGLFIVSSDAIGAYELGKLGSIAGGALGTAAAGVGAVPGAVIGGVVGALVGGIGMSYGAYVGSKPSGEIVYPPTIEEIVTTLSLSSEIARQESENYIAISRLNLPDSLERIGRYHNIAMSDLIHQKDGFDCAPQGNDILFPVDPGIKLGYEFSDFEMGVINSDSYINAFSLNSENVINGEYDLIITTSSSLMDKLMRRYLDALSNFCIPNDYENVISITNQYINIVNNSFELTTAEKNNLLISFAVAVYSYEYWIIIRGIE